MNRVIRLPGGRAVSLAEYVRSWKVIKTMPPAQEVRGWTWHPVPAGEILAQMRASILDRMNIRAGLDRPRGRKDTPEYDAAMYRDKVRLADMRRRVRGQFGGRLETKEARRRFGALLAEFYEN